MSSSPEQPSNATRLELRALEKMAAALCRHAELLWCEAANADGPIPREAMLHRQAFEERRREAMRLTKAPGDEPSALRIARLERLIEALEVSRAYFKALAAERG